MSRVFASGLFIVSILLPSVAQAVLTVDLGDVEKNEWTVTYRFEEKGIGKKSMDVLPYDCEMEVMEAFPEGGGTPLQWEPINEGKEKKSKFQISFPAPLGPGESFVFRLVAKMKDPNAYFLDSAKLNFLYSTGHRVNVTLPVGYYPIYTDEPMELKQDRGRVVLQSGGGKVRPVIIFAVRCESGD